MVYFYCTICVIFKLINAWKHKVKKINHILVPHSIAGDSYHHISTTHNEAIRLLEDKLNEVITAINQSTETSGERVPEDTLVSDGSVPVMTKLENILIARGKYSAGVARGEFVNLTGLSNREAKEKIKALMLELIGKDDRDYSQDNVDEQSKATLVASAKSCNELRAELRRKVEAL